MSRRKYDFDSDYRYSALYYKYRQVSLWHKILPNEDKRLYTRSFGSKDKQCLMFMLHFEKSNDIGVFNTLTNSYCISAEAESPTYNRILDQLQLRIPVIYTCIAGCRVVGRLSVGSKYGLLLPSTTTDLELEHIKVQMPDSVKISCVEEKLSALGNVIVCNDKIAIVHPDLDTETEEIIKDTLNVEVYRRSIGKQNLVGSICVLNNYGGFVHSKTQPQELEELSELLQIPVASGTVSKGKDCVSAGIAVNDTCGFLGLDSLPNEIIAMESIFGFEMID